MTDSDILTLAQAAALMQCSREALRVKAARGEIPGRRLGGGFFVGVLRFS